MIPTNFKLYFSHPLLVLDKKKVIFVCCKLFLSIETNTTLIKGIHLSFLDRDPTKHHI